GNRCPCRGSAGTRNGHRKADERANEPEASAADIQPSRTLPARSAWTLREEVVVAGGSKVEGDNRGGIRAEDAQMIDAAADARAVAAAVVPSAALSVVVRDLASADGDRRTGIRVHAAAQPGAAVAAPSAVPAAGEVVFDG